MSWSSTRVWHIAGTQYKFSKLVKVDTRSLPLHRRSDQDKMKLVFMSGTFTKDLGSSNPREIKGMLFKDGLGMSQCPLARSYNVYIS